LLTGAIVPNLHFIGSSSPRSAHEESLLAALARP
jgi:hypothetical protein